MERTEQHEGAQDALRADDSSVCYRYFGIEHYRPVYQCGIGTIATTHGARLSALFGRTLAHTWVLWDVGDDSWFCDAPVLFDFGDAQLEIQHNKLDELSITWNTIDPLSPVTWPDSALAWRNDAIPDLERLRGQPVVAGELLEWRVHGPDLANGMVAVGITFEHGQVLVHNALDENGLEFGRPRAEYRAWSADS